MLWNADLIVPNVERAQQLKAKEAKQASNPFAAVVKRTQKNEKINQQLIKEMPLYSGIPLSRNTLFLSQTAVPPWKQRVSAWVVLEIRLECFHLVIPCLCIH
jgi:hypothetical protein